MNPRTLPLPFLLIWALAMAACGASGDYALDPHDQLPRINFENQAVVASSWIARPIPWIQQASRLKRNRIPGAVVTALLSLTAADRPVLHAQAPVARFQYEKEDKQSVELYRLALAGGEITRVAKQVLPRAYQRVMQAKPEIEDFYWTVLNLAIAAQAQDQLRLFTKDEFSDIIRKILMRADLDPAHGLDFNFEGNKPALQVFQTPLQQQWVLTHELAHNWIYVNNPLFLLENETRMSKETLQEFKMMDEFIADIVALASIERSGRMKDADVKQFLLRGDLCNSCQLAPGQPILRDEVGRVLMLRLFNQTPSSKDPNRWQRALTVIRRELPKVSAETTFMDVAHRVFREAGISFNWEAHSWDFVPLAPQASLVDEGTPTPRRYLSAA